MVLLACAGCSSTSGGPSGGGGPICPADKFQLSGTINGSSESDNASTSGYLFENALSSTTPGRLDVGFGSPTTCGPDAGAGALPCTTGHLHLEWSTLVADDQTVQATGTLALPDQPNQTFCIASATITPRTQSEGNGVSFVINSFATGACPGTSVSGTMSGCASPSQ